MSKQNEHQAPVEAGGRTVPVGRLFLACAAVVTVWFYRDFIFYPERLIFGSDMLLEGVPLRQFLVDEVRAGRGVPQWTPHVYGGMPYVALLPGPVFYPTTLLYYLMPLVRAIGWTFVLHTFLAAAFGYFMARSFRLRPSAAAVCGTAFMLTGYVTSHLFGGQDGRMFAMVLMPLAFGLLERGLRSGDVRWFCGFALVVGMQIFTPHTQVMYFSSLAFALYLVFHLVVRVRPQDGPARRFARPLLFAGGAFVAAAAVGAVQLLPTLELLPHVTRQALETGYEFASSFALPAQELTALFLPDLIGSLGGYWGSNPLKLHTEYLGAVPVALALFALAAAFGGSLSREDRRIVWFLGAGSLLAILFALGAATPVHRIAYAVVPMVASFRAPAMMMCVVAVFIPLLAGFGWEAALRAREEGTLRLSWVWLACLAGPPALFALAAAANPAGLQNWALLAWYPEGWPRQPSPALTAQLRLTGMIVCLGFAVAVGGALAVARSRIAPALVVALLALTAFDLGRIGNRYLLTDPAAPHIATDPVIEALQGRVQPGERVWAIQQQPETYRPNRFMLYGLSSATGSQKFVLEPYARLIDPVAIDDALIRASQPLLSLLQARYLIARLEGPGEEIDLGAGADAPLVFRKLPAEAGGRLLYEMADPIPYAFFPARVEGAASPDEAVERTRSNTAPLRVAIVEGAGPLPAAGQGTASIVTYDPDLIEIDVAAEAGGLLAISEIHHPGWVATVDGTEVPIWRTNAAFRGVEVPAGAHRVRMEFRSAGYAIGRWLSLVAAAAMVGAIVVVTARERVRRST